ncbi:MAG: hypothetical protein IH892_18635 [Planctomycetes bacterium]|nr:hypothetical protein [Planctomycetota bacterium]
MLTLIRREIEDHLLLYTLILIFGLGHAALLAIYYHSEDRLPMAAIPDDILEFSFWSLMAFMMWAFVFEGVQRGFDQKEKISTFLFTLTSTRGQLLIAKWFAALIWLGCGLLPMALVHAYYLSRAAQWGAVQHVDLLVTQLGLTVLVPVSCYLLSQFLGLTQRPALSLLADVLITAVVISLVLVKGMSPPAIQQISVVLGILSLAAGIGTWSKFQTMSL